MRLRKALLLFIIATVILCLTTPAKAQTQTPQKTITLQLPVDAINTILSGLGKLPFEQANPIYQYIVTEANKQLAPPKPQPAKSDSLKNKRP